ncbi:MAG TPA: calcium/sodium antiporter [Gammaproteobacteria bacterium]|nr:calcium/sodium antiporter [Gammaproteobacteria bacterium]
MLMPALAIIAGFILLLWGADRFVAGAAAAARNLGISPLIIGLTIVGFGTSAPEILVSVMASINGNTALAIGNAIGSNITNIALVLGATALVTPLAVRSEILRREFPILLAVMLVALMMISDGELGRTDGIVLLTGLGLMLYWVVNLGLRDRRTDALGTEFDAEIPTDMSNLMAAVWFTLGLLLLLGGSRMLVWGAVEVATHFGVSELVIGLTIVAIGTSLPELAASIVSALRKEHDIAIGNVIGSNMFNLLAVMGLPGVIHPGPVPDQVLSRDYPVMLVLTLVLFAVAYGFRGPGKITRAEGGLLLLAFFAYQGVLFMSESPGS